ncbi:hypothetical protein D1BOALGB6SA_8814 [Olavius sp. associated proteobacterium Delta 1]|nr:hypothetical protein D1BOALGB6SA_8814 [Olavius sp. associated proteobacterium Delta 1]
MIKAENGCLTNIINYCRFNISCRIVRFPLFMPNIPWPRPIHLNLVLKAMLY